MRVKGFRIEQVTVTRGPATLLAQVSATIPAGRCTAVTGASGAGKSTLLRLLNRLDEPTTGRITLDGVPITELNVLALRRRVGLVAQASVLLTDRVLDEVRVGRHDVSEAGVVELLARVGLGQWFSERATAELSGGRCNGCVWRGRWPLNRTCCCWTSRLQRSTRPRPRSSAP